MKEKISKWAFFKKNGYHIWMVLAILFAIFFDIALIAGLSDYVPEELGLKIFIFVFTHGLVFMIYLLASGAYKRYLINP